MAGQTEMGSQNLSIESFHLGVEAREVVGSANRSGLGGDLRYGAVDTTVVAHGDPLRVRQILRNLLTNAARYGGNEVTVEVGQTEATAWLAVIDNGEGVPKRDSDRIFASYQRSGNADQQPKSVGLGLSVSRKLARLMSGDLTYTRNNGLTRFELTLPASSSPQRTVAEPGPAEAVTAQM